MTYEDLGLHLAAFRHQLRQAGFGDNARIGILIPNGPHAVLAIVDIACSAIAVPLDPRLTEAELDQRLEMLNLDALLLHTGSSHAARACAQRRRLPIIETASSSDGKLDLIFCVPTVDKPKSPEEQNPDAPAFILQTSGTTGQPKLISVSHGSLLAAATRLQAWFGLSADDRCLLVSPPFYSHGLTVTTLTPLLTGGSIAVPSNPAVVNFAEWFQVLKPTWYSAGPTLHRAVCEASSMPAQARTHQLRLIVSGGAPLPQQVRDGLETNLGVPVLDHYGSSEGMQIASNLPGASKTGSCGRPWPETVRIVSPDGDQCQPGERGELMIRGPTVTSGYLNNPQLNQAAFKDGWFRTGDLASLDEDGFLWLHGRMSELINRGGEKIAPLEIDQALLRHPAVTEAAAFAVPHARLGEDVAAAVVLRSSSPVTPQELRHFLLDWLTPYKIPHRILVMDHLPKGKSGKIERRRLTETYATCSQTRQAPDSPPSGLEADLLRIWRRLLKTESLTLDDNFFEQGGDSLLAMEMLLEVEEMVGHRVPETVLFGAETIRQLVPKIGLQTNSGPCMQFGERDDQPPLFFFHGDLDSGGLQARAVVKRLAYAHSVVTIEPHGLRGSPVPRSIEDMARDRLPLILQRQASGPFKIGGYCNGALVAFEVARLLRDAGHEIAFVMMVDPPTASAHPGMRLILSLAARLTSPIRAARIYTQLNRYESLAKLSLPQLLIKARMRLTGESVWKGPAPSDLFWTYSALMARYRPKPLTVPVIFYQAMFNGHTWRHLSQDLEVVDLPGDHNNCMAVGSEILAEDVLRRVPSSSWRRELPHAARA